MKNYLALVEKILDEGEERGDRTGTGTISLFGERLEFNLKRGFPLLTTKKLHIPSIVHELLWFISGKPDAGYLKENGVTIWDSWLGPNGEAGPVYGWNWRHYGALPDAVPPRAPKLRQELEPTLLGVANGSGSSGKTLARTWYNMISRCYDPSSKDYPRYGGRGVTVCDRWLEYRAFEEDVAFLPGWEKKQTDPEYQLDKDIRGTGFEYGPEECAWVSPAENAAARLTKTYVITNGTIEREFQNVTAFARSNGLIPSELSRLVNGRVQNHKGWELVRVEDRSTGFDQLAWAIEQIKTHPENRRIMVSAWRPDVTHLMALPPCHFAFQFYCHGNGDLSLQMHQRSADIGLGVPFNIASYALLLHMVAHVTGRTARRLIITFGDVHVYKNHVGPLHRQLCRTPLPLPQLKIRRDVQSIDDFTINDFAFIDYAPWPHIPMKVAV